MIIDKEKTIGVFFIIVGIIFISLSLNYSYGSLNNIGPGFFPRWIGIFILLIGIYSSIKSFFKKNISHISLKVPIILMISIFSIPIIYNFSGMVLAISFMIILSSILDRKFSIKDTSLILIFSIIALTIIKILFLPGLRL
jgi:hypothetical protein